MTVRDEDTSARRTRSPDAAPWRVAIYTSVYDRYDYVPVPRVGPEARGRTDLVCLSDDPKAVPSGWSVIEVERGDLSPTLANRKAKILGHPELEAYDATIYIDANVALAKDPIPLVMSFLRDAPIAIPEHGERACLYDEADACVRLRKADPNAVRELVAGYERDGFPRGLGLTDNGFIARRNGDENLAALMAAWWKAVEVGPHRDQLHLMYLVWRLGVRLAVIPRSAIDAWDGFRRMPHRVSHGPVRRRFFAAMAAHYHSRAGQVLERVWDAYGRVGSEGDDVVTEVGAT